jgi:glycine betaine/proline transport system permease protein
MGVLAQTEDVPFRSNDILDQFEIPVGSWIDQMVDWIDINFGEREESWFPLLKWIEWPFDFLLRNLVDGLLLDMSWTTLCIIIFFVGYFVRNAKVGFISALGLAGCGLLGEDYWLETARTVGFIAVAVLLCIVIGIPLGVACGRIDGLWGVVRPVLDAMQVVHSFVYMLPFIFFFGIGENSATMVTMVFALPPLIRLTNLGIRQVPEDVVEASRAYGAPEWRVLIDVQLPLARPAIMTGINQTLLLSISMLGIAAIMGAGGLGRLLFQALSNLDVAQAASGGLAFFLVAVVMDRLSQPEEDDGSNLFSRIARAWANRTTPEELIPVGGHAQIELEEVDERTAPVGAKERAWLVVTGVAGFVTVLSVFMTWGNDSGLVSAHGRRVDEDLLGQSFNGIAASGGTFFGYFVFGCAMLAVYSAVNTLLPRVEPLEWMGNEGIAFVINYGLGFLLMSVLFDNLAVIIVFAAGFALVRPAHTSRWTGADGAVLVSIGGLIIVIGYLFIGQSSGTVQYSHGPGVYLALIASIATVGAACQWMWAAPYAAHRPLSAKVGVGSIIGAGAAIAMLVIAGFSGWTFDQRADSVITPEVQAEIDRLTELGRTDPANASTYAADISATMARVQRTGTIVRDGFTDDGAGLGGLTLAIVVVGFGLTLPATGVFGRDESKRYRWSAIAAGVGLGVVGITLAWIVSLARVNEGENIVSGAGAFLAFAGGFFLLAANRGTVAEFFRSKVYGSDEKITSTATEERDEELASV